MTKKRQRQRLGTSQNMRATNEKIFLVAFLIFAIVIIILLFRNPSLTTPTGQIIANVKLDKPIFDQNEYLKGDVSLEFQEGDLLPAKTNVSFFIRTNIPRCPKYVCLNNKTVDWYEWDETLEECVLAEPDPEGLCCSKYKDCSQLIVNSGFEKMVGTLPYKWRSARNVGGTIIEIEPDYPVDEVTLSSVAVIDTENVRKAGYAALWQSLEELRLSSESDLESEQNMKTINFDGWSQKHQDQSESENENLKTEKTLKYDGLPVTQCLHANPTVTITPSTQSGTAGTKLTYKLAITNNDNQYCADATFSLTCWPFLGFDCLLGQESITLPPGTSNWPGITLEITSESGKTPGDYTFTVKAENKNYPLYKGEDDAIYKVYKEPCSGNVSFGFIPSTVSPGSTVSTDIGVYKNGMLVDPNCEGKTAYLKRNSCYGATITSCNLEYLEMWGLKADTCTVNFNAPSTEGTYTYCGCVDYNDDAIYSSNEYGCSSLEVEIPECTPGQTRQCNFQDQEGTHKGLEQCKQDGRWSECMPYKLKAKIGYEAEEGCAFEIILKSSDYKELHYYYLITDVPGCGKPIPAPNQAYIDITQDLYAYDWYLNNFSVYLFDDWQWPIPPDFKLEEIWLKSYGTKIEDYYYGQIVRWDDVKLITSAKEASPLCGERGKKCCVAGTGLEEYYDLDCPEGYECWSKCAPSDKNSLSWFIGKSDARRKKNITTGEYTYIKPAADQLPGELCVDDKCFLNYDYGTGYAACLDVSEDSPERSCRGWDNIYTTNIYSTRLRTPRQNGSYELVVRLEYTPEGEYCGEYEDEEGEIHIRETCIISETEIPFKVGEGVPPPCEPNWINCSNATICGAATNYKELFVYKCTDANNCSIACNESIRNLGLEICKNWGPTGEKCEPEIPACKTEHYDTYEDDWCDDWAPTPCMPDEIQTRTCTADPTICNDTAPGAQSPIEEQDCTIDVIIEYVEEQRAAGRSRSSVENELKQLEWSSSEIKRVLDTVYGPEERLKWWIWVLIIVIIVAAVIIFLRIRMKKPAKKAAVPPELLSYIKDAIAAGATKSEIASRLVQAGWPRESVDAALKTIK